MSVELVTLKECFEPNAGAGVGIPLSGAGPRLINLQSAREELSPHSTGKAKCLICGYECVSVAPTGADYFMECPKCGVDKLVFKHPHQRAEKHWVCNCGNMNFLITPECVYCPSCGAEQKGF